MPPNKNVDLIGNAFAIFGEISTTFHAIACVALALVVLLVGVKLLGISRSDTATAIVYGLDSEGARVLYYDETGAKRDAFLVTGQRVVPGQSIRVFVDPMSPGIVVDHSDSFRSAGLAMISCALAWMFLAYYMVKVVYSRENIATLVGGVSAISTFA